MSSTTHQISKGYIKMGTTAHEVANIAPMDRGTPKGCYYFAAQPHAGASMKNGVPGAWVSKFITPSDTEWRFIRDIDNRVIIFPTEAEAENSAAKVLLAYVNNWIRSQRTIKREQRTTVTVEYTNKNRR